MTSKAAKPHSKLKTPPASDSLAGLHGAVAEIVEELRGKEAKQDAVIGESRQLIRDCANAIRHIHTGEASKARVAAAELEKKIAALKSRVGDDFEGITHPIYQEYTEIMTLLAVHEKKPIPTRRELGVPAIAYLSGLADAVGELRRALQISLKDGQETLAESYYTAMNGIYESLMVVKFSSSIVRDLKRKQDVARMQLEQARSEMLRSSRK